jgi:hypothetical protein
LQQPAGAGELGIDSFASLFFGRHGASDSPIDLPATKRLENSSCGAPKSPMIVRPGAQQICGPTIVRLAAFRLF